MAISKISDEEFIELFETIGPIELAQRLGYAEPGSMYKRRRNLEKKFKRQIRAPGKGNTRVAGLVESRVTLNIKNGVVLVGSDSHYWPGYVSTAHRAFVKFCGELKPRFVIKNGDELDGATISRHAPIGWEGRPDLIEELDVTKERLDEIKAACNRNVKFLWPLGNHDARFETRLATVAPQYARVHGFHLKDHFPEWRPCWSCWINNDVVIKHRFRGGIHATRNNTLNSGKTMVTGHLHSLKVTPFSDYNGTRWGVDCGTIADPYGPQFEDYTEDNPKDWRSGFVVLTFDGGQLRWPEVVHVVREGTVEFRGKTYEV